MVSNIKHIVNMPNIVGRVDLSLLNKKVVKELKFLLWKNFPLKDYEALLELVKTINRKIGKDSVSLSKIGRVNGEIVPTMGSIRYSCGTKDFRVFKTAYALFEIATRYNLKKVNSITAQSLPNGSTIHMVYVKDDRMVEMVKNIVDIPSDLSVKAEGLWYHSASDKNAVKYVIYKKEMSVDTFETGVDDETGYFFVDNVTKPAVVSNYPKGLDSEGNEWKG
jgi:hypothetical protein